MEFKEPTGRQRLEVAEILRESGEAYRARHPVSPDQSAVITHLMQCRTAALGGHVDSCQNCGHTAVSYNSCRNRHCPKCQSQRSAEWIEKRIQRLLPVPYFHVVFTFPDDLNPLALRNKRVIYDILFETTAATLLEIAADPKHLGAQIGFTAILHTWGQNLLLHPHVHCVVTGGGLSPEGDRWIPTRQGFLLPIRVLARLFRGKFLARLDEAYRAGVLSFHGSTEKISDRRAFAAFKDQLYRKEWVVYAKPPFGGVDHVFRYLGQYTHRVAISNSRLISFEGGLVTFRYKDYADGCRKKVMRLMADEFIRRFLLHVLPQRFVRIRHYGLLAARNVHSKLERCRELLGAEVVRAEEEGFESLPPNPDATVDTDPDPSRDEPRTCPSCGMRRVVRELLHPIRESPHSISLVNALDSS